MNNHIIEDIDRGSYFTGRFYITPTLYDRTPLFTRLRWRAKKYSARHCGRTGRLLSLTTGRKMKVRETKP